MVKGVDMRHNLPCVTPISFCLLEFTSLYHPVRVFFQQPAQLPPIDLTSFFYPELSHCIKKVRMVSTSKLNGPAHRRRS